MTEDLVRLPELGADEIAGRWPGPALGSGRVRLLTVQRAAAYQQMLLEGRLSPERSHVPAAYEAAYAWMRERLAGSGRAANGAAVWGWTRVDLPGLVRSWPPAQRRDAVVLVADLPVERVLVSAFEPWHDLLEHEGLPDASWAGCFDLEAWPHSALQAVTGYVDLEELVSAYRLRPEEPRG